MGFWIQDDITHKQHINLSYPTWLTIEEDIKNFGNGAKYNLAGFLNRIFFNFCHDADASISERLINKGDELEKLFSAKEFKKMDKATTDTYITAILNVYEKELKDKVASYEKGEGQKFNINKENVELLRQSVDNIYYDGDNIGKYLKAIYEEYAQKPMFEREQIYFKDVVDEIKSAISQKKKLKLALLPKLSLKTNEYYTRRFYLAPLKIVQDKTRSFNYVVGYAEEIYQDGNLRPRQISVFRISHIDHISTMSSMSGFISISDKEAIEKMISEKEVQFLTGDLMDFKIRFTEKGLEAFSRQLYMRPRIYESVPGEPNTFIFHCTEIQVINYFIKLGRDVEVLEPETTRQKFVDRYRDALKVYNPKQEE